MVGAADGQVVLDASNHIVHGLQNDAESVVWERQSVHVRKRGLAPADQGVAARSRPDLTADVFYAQSGVWDGGRLTEEGECGA